MTKIVLFSSDPMSFERLRACISDQPPELFPTSEAGEIPNLASRVMPDLILVDVTEPEGRELDGLASLKENPLIDTVPILLAVERDQADHKTRAMSLGIDDIIHKPFDSLELGLRIRNLSNLTALRDEPRELKESLRRIRKEKLDREESLKDILFRLSWVAEHRDADVPDHLRRISRVSRLVAERMGWAEEAVERIERASLMHDIGKSGVPEAVLFKPGPLTAGEYDLAKMHTTIGADILDESGVPLVQMAERIARYHHERWDGAGYPEGLKGDQIPLEARIVAVVDVFDALATTRCYKKALPIEHCFEVLREGSGKHFDPSIIDVIEANRSDVAHLYQFGISRDHAG